MYRNYYKYYLVALMTKELQQVSFQEDSSTGTMKYLLVTWIFMNHMLRINCDEEIDVDQIQSFPTCGRISMQAVKKYCLLKSAKNVCRLKKILTSVKWKGWAMLHI